MKEPEILRVIYNRFQGYFKFNKIVIGGSYYFASIGCQAPAEFKDLDLIVDEDPKNDKLLYDIKDFLNAEYELKYEFIGRFEDKKLVATLSVKDQIDIDLLRNDLSDNLPQIEIFPGIKSFQQSPKKLIEVYSNLKILAEKYSPDKIEKYNQIIKFYESKRK